MDLQICDEQTDTPKIFADLRSRMNPESLHIYDLRNIKKFCVPTFDGKLISYTSTLQSSNLYACCGSVNKCAAII
jgi:hypothetical protein